MDTEQRLRALYVAVEIDQTVRDLNGALLSEGRVRHVYASEDGLVVSMEVE